MLNTGQFFFIFKFYQIKNIQYWILRSMNNILSQTTRTYVPKVALSARYLGLSNNNKNKIYMGLKGDYKQRQERQKNLLKNLSRIFYDVFLSKHMDGKEAAINIKELREIISQVFKGTDIQVKSGFSFSVEPVIKRKVVQGYKFFVPKIPNDKNIIKLDDENGLKNFNNNLIQLVKMVTTPKLLARLNSNVLTDTQKVHQSLFYQKFIGNFNYKTFGISNQNSNYIEKYSQHIMFLKQEIQRFFEKEKCSHEQKIELLQYWRYAIDIDLKTTRTKIFGKTKGKYISGKDEIEKISKEDYSKYCFLNEKKALIGTLLKNEMKFSGHFVDVLNPKLKKKPVVAFLDDFEDKQRILA